ncbi:MAG: DUF2760 domain-containing protein [Myxococcaceae bacterium]
MSEQSLPSFWTRFGMAFVCFFRILFNAAFAGSLLPQYLGLRAPLPSKTAAPEKAIAPQPATAKETHASGLFVLSMLQREGRLIDFLQEDIASFSDAEVGAASRVVHEGCRKVVRQYLVLEPVLKDSEGAAVNVPEGFDAQQIRLTGNVAGRPPFKGALRHHGWITRDVRFPQVPQALDSRILAPAEVELS